VVLLIIVSSCLNIKQERLVERRLDANDTIPEDTIVQNIDRLIVDTSENIVPVFGYRFVVSGDFNGDGKQEMLVEHYVSGKDNKETNKYYDGLSDYGQLVELTIEKEAISYVLCDNAVVDTLHISSGGQLLGLSYLKNEGDLNGDGTDELSYVVNWADWSSINTSYLMTYKNGKWEKLYEFGIWDWQLPNLPYANNNYGFFGVESVDVNTKNDSINKIAESELNNFEGFITKKSNNHIEVRFRNEEAMEDTVLIDLSY
jgi:hypothetical protein